MGMRQVCPEEMVTYTCTVTEGFALEWAVEPFLPGSAGIKFTSITHVGTTLDCNNVTAVRCEDFQFVATLTNTSNPTVVVSTTLADMTTTLTFTATARLNGTVVQCRGLTVNAIPIVNSTLSVAGTPIVVIMLPTTRT